MVEVKPVDAEKGQTPDDHRVSALLLIVGAVVGISYLLPPGAEDTLAAAQKACEQTNYAQGIEQYASFLERFPQDRRVSDVRVRRALAKIRLALQQPNSGVAALKVAQKVVKDLQSDQSDTPKRPSSVPRSSWRSSLWTSPKS